MEQATRGCQARLDQQSPLLDQGLAREAYRRLFGRLFGYYAPLEARLYGSPGWHEVGLTYRERSKTPRLALDLIALGTAPDTLAALPHCPDLPDLASGARLFGCLYVIEGATLGGQIIKRHLHTHLGLTAQSGAAFFAAYGRQTGSHWKAFGKQLTALVQRSGGDDEIIAAADQTFATSDGWRATPTAWSASA